MKSKNKIDWNFHINFSPLYFVFAVMVLMVISFNAEAEEIEEVVVVAQQSKTVEADPLEGISLIRVLLPAHTWTAGGQGAFQGYNERGAQTVHTAVYKNGIPANLPGSAWYDFGTELATGQSIKIISGANSVVYGSGSIAGTILIKDVIEKGVTVSAGSQSSKYVSLAPSDWFQYTAMEVDQDSVRNDNTEKDLYTNRNAKFNFDVQDFTIAMDYTDYEYGYDNCWAADFSQSNDCKQDGEKYNVAVNNEYFTIGRTHDKAHYFTGDYESYWNESSTDYLRVGDQTNLSQKLQIAYGVDASHEQYLTAGGDHNRDNYGAYLNINADFAMKYNFGFRVGNEDQNALRFGLEKGAFFLNVGNSFRRPTLYELNGDSWVDANLDLLPEEGIGYELGFGVLSIFKYEFEEAIEYAPGGSNDIITITYDEDGNPITTTTTEYYNAKYYNTGAYDTQGIRYSQTFGNFLVTLKYTDTEQARVPKYSAVLGWDQSFGSHNFNITYRAQYERIPGLYDGTELEDLQNLSFRYIKTFANEMELALNIDNMLDEQVEVLPGYDSRGRQIMLTLQRKW
tara:strand:+ start:550 stop:2250 length:1701 start_codon:yes stop_codon:yes gene_type:complete